MRSVQKRRTATAPKIRAQCPLCPRRRPLAAMKPFAWEAPPNRGSLKRRPHLWHSRAGGGAVHSIKSRLMQCSNCLILNHLAGAARDGVATTRPDAPVPFGNDFHRDGGACSRDEPTYQD